MSSAFRYSAARARPLDDRERVKVLEVAAAWSVSAQIEDFHRTGHGWSGEDFDVALDGDGELVHGSMTLPSSRLSMLIDPDAELWNAILHWSDAVTALRRELAGATWEVSVDSQEIEWNARSRAYVPDVPDSARERRTHRQRWEQAVVGAVDVRAYAPGATLTPNELIGHASFGRGVVLRTVGPTKVEVLFREGPRMLAHALAGAPVTPPPAKELDLDNFPTGDDPF